MRGLGEWVSSLPSNEPLHEKRSHRSGLGPGAKPGIEPKIHSKLMINTGPAKQNDELIAKLLLLHELNQRSCILLVAVTLRNHLRNQNRISAKSASPLDELLVLDLGAEVVGVEALVALEA